MTPYNNEFIFILLAGFFGSYHCIGMCSPIAIMFIDSKGKRSVRHILYNMGRLFTYGFMGFAAGLAGADVFRIFQPIGILQKALTITFGLFMIFFGAQMLLRFKKTYRPFFKPLYDVLCSAISKLTKSNSISAPFVTGMFNGFLPCPLVYAFLTRAASTLNPYRGLEIMLFMGVGTMPAMFIAGRFFMGEKRLFIKRGFTVLAGMMVVYLGVVSLLRAMPRM